MNLKTWVSRTIKILSIAIGIILLAWIGVYIYFRANKHQILEKTIAAVKKNINGTVTVGDIGLSFPSTFPYLSVELDNVIIRDSLYALHKHNLLGAANVYLQINPLNLLVGHLTISRIVAENGSIYVFRDSTGYTNLDAFKKQEDDKGTKSKNTISIGAVRLVNMRLISEKLGKNLFDFSVRNLVCRIFHEGANDRFRVNVDLLANSFVLNLNKGSFVKNKTIRTDISLLFHKPSRALSFRNADLNIAGEHYDFSGTFNFSGERFFHLDVFAPKADFQQTVSLLPDSIRKNLAYIGVSKRVNAKAAVDGRLIPGYKATVRVDWQVKDADIQSPFGNFESAGFTGFFYNKMSDTLPAVPENSMVQLNNFRSQWSGIALQSNKIALANLKKPVLYCDLKARADMSMLDDLIPTESFHFEKGELITDVVYNGPIYDSAIDAPSINGYCRIRDGALVYGPRNIELKEVNGDIIFRGTDVMFKDVSALAQGNRVTMNVTGTNLLTLMNSDPSKAILRAEISSPELDISRFTSFIGGRRKKTSARNGKNKKLGVAASRIDKLLDQCSILSVLSARIVRFNKFTATNVKSELALTNEVWALRNTSFQHAGGSVVLDGELRGGSHDYNPLTLKASLRSIDIAQLFTAFHDFNLSSLHAKNLAGRLSSDINISGALLEKAQLVPSSLKGTVTLSLSDGELNNFEPLKKMSSSVLKNRDFSHVNFSQINNRFDVKGSLVYINRMEIQSNVLQLFMEGLYDISGKSTNLEIQVPLSNLKKPESANAPKKEGIKSNQGISVYVNAKSADNGDINFSYSLFHKKIKKK